MRKRLDLIYCAGQNRRLMSIAQDAGFLLGIRSDRKDYGFPIQFVDIDYKAPDFPMHLAVVKRHQPKYATVPDLSDTEVSEPDIIRAVKQAEQLASYCGTVLLVPKLSGQLAFIPTDYAVAYSVPTSYGGAKYGAWKLSGRRVHLLGGSPHAQMKLARYLPESIQSADGNMAQLMSKFAKYWQAWQWIEHPRRGQKEKDLYLECWELSCQNIYRQWQQESEQAS